MIKSKLFGLKKDKGKNQKNGNRDHFLYDFKLYQSKWATVSLKANSISRHLKEIFKKGNAPADKDYGYNSSILKPLPVLKL